MAPPVLKCVIWDLDDTLWQGTLPEGDPVTVNADALLLLRRLEAAGIVQSVVSKNDRDDAVRTLTAFGLMDVFVYPQISWSAKSEAVDRIIHELDLGEDSVVFLDDSAFERAEVASRLPAIRCFSLFEFLKRDARERLIPDAVSADAQARPRLYQRESLRRSAQAGFAGTSTEFLTSLRMVLTVRLADREDLDRAAELTERTNQLNTTGLIFSVDDLDRLRNEDGNHVLIAELTDRFGDYGRIGLCLVRRRAESWLVELLLLSCRVMGRNIGNAVIGTLGVLAAADGLPLRVAYRPNGRNRQMKITLALSGFSAVGHEADRLLYEHCDPGEIKVPSYVTVAAPLLSSDRQDRRDVAR